MCGAWVIEVQARQDMKETQFNSASSSRRELELWSHLLQRFDLELQVLLTVKEVAS